MLPLLIAAALVAVSAVQTGFNIYSTNETTKASDRYNDYVQDFYSGKMAENTAYFDRYIKAHHLDPKDVKFPYRTGMIFDESKIYNAEVQQLYNQYARYGSYVNGGANVVRSGLYGYGFTHPVKNTTRSLYGN